MIVRVRLASHRAELGARLPLRPRRRAATWPHRSRTADVDAVADDRAVLPLRPRRIAGADVVAPGSPGAVTLHGRVLDGSGEPLSDALVELWQADADGAFATSDDGRRLHAASAAASTDGDGRYRSPPCSPDGSTPTRPRTSTCRCSPAACSSASSPACTSRTRPRPTPLTRCSPRSIADPARHVGRRAADGERPALRRPPGRARARRSSSSGERRPCPLTRCSRRSSCPTTSSTRRAGDAWSRPCSTPRPPSVVPKRPVACCPRHRRRDHRDVRDHRHRPGRARRGGPWWRQPGDPPRRPPPGRRSRAMSAITSTTAPPARTSSTLPPCS